MNCSVLGRRLLPWAEQFVATYADFLTRVDFRDIAGHPVEDVRSNEGFYEYDGMRHHIWLSTSSPDFEGLMMHEVMRGMLIEEGFPQATCSIASSPSLQYLSALLPSAIIDPIIDGRLITGGFSVYDRQLLIERAMGEAWVDRRSGRTSDDDFLFRKWTLFTVLLRLDTVFHRASMYPLFTLLKKKFPRSVKLGEELAERIGEKGFAEPRTALTAMIELRSNLRLDEIELINAYGMSW